MKRFNTRFMPLKFKLLAYFLIFGAIILVVLWSFQAFMLKPFYTASKRTRVEQSAKRISRSIEQNKNVWNTIDNVASYNSLSVYVYDSSSGLLYLLYDCPYDNPSLELALEYHEVVNYYRQAEQNNGTYMCVVRNTVTNLAKQKIKKISSMLASPDSANAIRYKADESDLGQNMVYADIITTNTGKERFLLITSSLSPLNTTVEILQSQLRITSMVFVVLAILFSVYASRRIARPISKTNSAAKELAKKNYNVNFNAKGYLEVKELNDTLNYAKTELAATEKLQRELIANISHDLRTPLTMITGYAEVMRDLPGENTPENIQIIIDEATRLSTLVNDLLDLSKLQSGALQAEKKTFCLTDSVNAMFSRYNKLVEQDGYSFVFEPKENVFINADELRISQVIYNLVNNAINHCGEDKTVIINQTVKGRKVTVEVTDHGEGIPSDKLQYIWDRYYKVDKQHKRGVIGSGLGLSIVKNILDAHNARYGVRSAVGKGSTFWFELDTEAVKKLNKK